MEYRRNTQLIAIHMHIYKGHIAHPYTMCSVSYVDFHSVCVFLHLRTIHSFAFYNGNIDILRARGRKGQCGCMSVWDCVGGLFIVAGLCYCGSHITGVYIYIVCFLSYSVIVSN